MHMRKIALATLAALALAAPALAESHTTTATAATISMDTVLGTSFDEITTTLAGMGYEVRKAEMEDGSMEVYFVGHGRMGEVYVNPETGRPTKIEMK